MEPRIIDRHGTLYVLDKPAGLSVHPTNEEGAPCLTDWLRDSHGADAAPIHRIDRATSGLVLLSTDRRERADWGRRFAAGEVRKTYLAFVAHRPPADGLIDMTLFDSRRKCALEARTEYTTKRCFYDCAYIEVHPFTGRKHQIRRHFAAVGHPVLGDVRYGLRRASKRSLRRIVARPNPAAPCDRMWLHSAEIQVDGVHFTTGVPADFDQFARALAAKESECV